MRYLIFTVSAILLFLSTNALSQSEKNIFAFTGRDFNKPFVSEISSPLNHLSFGKVESTKISGKGLKNLTINEIHFGIDLPVIYSNKNKLKWALSIPISTHMVWFPLEETTSPILNNDYRFGFSYSGHVEVGNPYIKNLSFEIKPFAHESTHLGDEFTISGFQDDTSFYRVNISYEFYELSLIINDPEVLNENTLSLKLGYMGLIDPHKGYYTIFENEVGENTLYPSKRNGELYIDLNYKKVNGFLTHKQWQPNISLEIRNRIKFDYKNTGKEDRVWCINAYAGYNFTPKILNTVKSIGHYIRYYNGVTPHGQFRIGTCYYIGYSLFINI